MVQHKKIKMLLTLKWPGWYSNYSALFMKTINIIWIQKGKIILVNKKNFVEHKTDAIFPKNAVNFTAA
jgi:hypothetical protein